MFNGEDTGGEAKGSLKDRLKILHILLKIAHKKKIKGKFDNINSSKISRIKRITMFFYNPVKLFIPESSKIHDIVLYDAITWDLNYNLNKEKKNIKKTDFEFKKNRRFKKGLGTLEEIIASNNDTMTFPIVDGLPERDAVIDYIESKAMSEDEIKSFSSKYGIENEVTPNLIYDILILKYYSGVIFDEELTEEEIDAFIEIRINASEIHDIINESAIEEAKLDTISRRDESIDESERKKLLAELNLSELNVKKLEQLLNDQNVKIEKMFKEINIFSEKTIFNNKLVGLNQSLHDFLGIGLGLLTLPFSRSRTFALGTNLIRNSVTNIKKNVRYETKEEVVRDYRISEKDIITADAGVKTSTFFLDDTFEQLQDIKFRVRYYANVIPDYQKMLRQIELMEQALVKKRVKLRKIEESLTKSKVKVLERNKKVA